MNKTIYIGERSDYDYCVKEGFEPLIDPAFRLDINLRVDIQQELFGRGVFGKSVAEANEKFYKWVWEHKPHYCEETLRPLSHYSASFISHILTRGAFPELATDPRNVNILCIEKHQQWETGDREKMRIYFKNIKTINLLRGEYHKLKK